MFARLFRRPDPFAVTLGVLDALEKQAERRRDMKAVGQIGVARSVITRECLRGTR